MCVCVCVCVTLWFNICVCVFVSTVIFPAWGCSSGRIVDPSPFFVGAHQLIIKRGTPIIRLSHG